MPEPVVRGELGPELGQRRHNEDARHGDEVEVPPAGKAEEAVSSHRFSTTAIQKWDV